MTLDILHFPLFTRMMISVKKLNKKERFFPLKKNNNILFERVGGAERNVQIKKKKKKKRGSLCNSCLGS